MTEFCPQQHSHIAYYFRGWMFFQAVLELRFLEANLLTPNISTMHFPFILQSFGLVHTGRTRSTSFRSLNLVQTKYRYH
jgi:hypothetical protein